MPTNPAPSNDPFEVASKALEELMEADETSEDEEVPEDAPPEDEDAPPEDEDAPPEDEDAPEDPVEKKKAGLRQADYTKKTMALAEERKQLRRELEEVRALRAQLEGKQKSPKVEEEESLPEGATAEQVVAHYVSKEVKKALASIRDEIAPLAPAAKQTKVVSGVVSAYQEMASANGADPLLMKKEVRQAVGMLLESDEDLGELAETNPKAAVRMASKQILNRLSQMKKEKALNAKKGTSIMPSKNSGAAPAKKGTLDPLEVAAAELKKLRAANN